MRRFAQRVALPALAVAAACAAGLLAVACPGACAPAWTVVYPPNLPAGAARTCDLDGKVQSLCGFLDGGRGLVVWLRVGKAAEFRKALAVCDPASGKVVWQVAFEPGNDVWGPVDFRPDGTVVFWDVSATELWKVGPASGERIARWDLPGAARSCALSADGRLLVLADAEGVRLHDATAGRRLRTLPWDAAAGRRPLLSPDARLVALVGGASVRVLDTEDGRPMGEIRLPDGTMALLAGEVCGFSAGGRTFVVREQHRLPMQPGDRGLKQPIVEAGAEPLGPVRMGGSTLVYDVRTGRLLQRLDLRSTVSADRRHLIEWPEGRHEMLGYDLTDATLAKTIRGACNRPALGGGVLAAAEPLASHNATEQRIGFWDLATGRKLGRITLADRSWGPVALSGDGRFVLLRDGSGLELCLADRLAGRKRMEWHFAPDRGSPPPLARSVRFSPDLAKLAFDAAGRAVIVHLPALAAAK